MNGHLPALGHDWCGESHWKDHDDPETRKLMKPQCSRNCAKRVTKDVLPDDFCVGRDGRGDRFSLWADRLL